MKKCNLLILAIIAVAIIYSCKKEPFHNISMENHQQIYTAEELSVWKKLNDFNRLIKSSEKSGESVSADSAVWLMEALFNATETSREPFDDFYTDSAFYTIPVDNEGNVSMDDVSEVYNIMVSDFQVRFAAFPNTYKVIVLADLVNIENAKNGELQVGVNRGFGLNTLSLYEEFDSTDNWFYGNQLGKCNDTSTRGSDAGFELERRFNHPDIQYQIPHDSNHIVATSIDTQNVQYDMYPKYMWDILYPNVDTCITYDSLNYFLVMGHDSIIYNYESTGGKRPIGKDFYFSDVRTSPVGGQPNTNGLYRHSYILYYGVFVNIPPIEELKYRKD